MASLAPSVVMGLVTAAAFGMAARDAAVHTYRTPREEEEADRKRIADEEREFQRAYDAKRAEDAAEVEAAGAKRVQLATRVVPTLLGQTIGPGVALQAGEELDASLAALDIRDDADPDTGEHWLRVRPGDTAAPQLCALFSAATGLAADGAWGPPYMVGERRTWADAATGHRVAYETSGPTPQCSLRFDRSVSTRDWLDRVVPGRLLGQPSTALVKWIEGRLATIRDEERGDDTLWTWTDSGLGTGAGRTEVAVGMEHGKIISVHASVDPGDARLADELESRWGAGEIDAMGAHRWSKPTPRQLSEDGDTVQLDLGK